MDNQPFDLEADKQAWQRDAEADLRHAERRLVEAESWPDKDKAPGQLASRRRALEEAQERLQRGYYVGWRDDQGTIV